ncbi:MAG: hypothetical protein HGB10_06625 [Coriobacteriia bacterium]|nr:hypothetical protein [Coriobacteriia bacterium]
MTTELAADAVDAQPATQAPRVFDTYAVTYAFGILFLVPGAFAISRLPFREYTAAYVSLVTVPFVLAILATFLTDSADPMRTKLLRSAVLVPLVLLSGVTVLFTSSFIVLPISQVLTPAGFDIAGPIAIASLIALALPLLPATWRRLRTRMTVRSAAQTAAILFALTVVAIVVVLTLRDDRTLATMQRKDVVIYIVGALVWYLPSFGIAAGAWRRVDVV